MSKTPSDKLYRLIHSLSPAEKRYFRIFIRGKTVRDSKYLRLFDAIEQMERFDEEKLKAKIYKTGKPEGKKYSELKAYLYELVLKSLQAFDEQQSADYRLNQMLQSVAVLFKRGHYEDCRELLAKAARLAYQFEQFAHLLDILRWEKQLAYTRMDTDYLHKKLEKIQDEEQRIVEKMQNTIRYRQVFFEVYTAIKRDARQTGDARREQLEVFFKSARLDNPDLALSHRARVMYYRTRNLYDFAVGDYEAFYESGRQLIEIQESQPHFLKENLSDYIAALSNMILAGGLRRRYDEVRLNLLKMRQLSPITEDDRQKIHRQYFTGIFVLCMYTGEFEEARREMAHCQEEAKGFNPQDYETASFYFQYCLICLGAGDYAGALDHLNHWQSRPRTVEREDLQSLGRLLLLILHYELGNTVLLESLVRSATRFLQKQNRYSGLEQRFLHLVSELIRLAGQRERREAFQRMSDDLKTRMDDPAVKTLLQTFDLEAWLESKVSGQTFAAVLKEKWKREQAVSGA